MKRLCVLMLTGLLAAGMAACTPEPPHEPVLSSTPDSSMTVSSKESMLSSYEPEPSSKAAESSDLAEVSSAAVSSDSEISSDIDVPSVFIFDTSGFLYEPTVFYTRNELEDYLKNTDLGNTDLEVIRDERIYYFPRIVEHPQSDVAQKAVKMNIIIDSDWVRYSFYDDQNQQMGVVLFNTRSNTVNKNPMTSEELKAFVTRACSLTDQYPCEIIQTDHQTYIRRHVSIYYMTDYGHMITIALMDPESSYEQVLLFAQDIIVEKYSLD